jgi:hypothetical protein
MMAGIWSGLNAATRHAQSVSWLIHKVLCGLKYVSNPLSRSMESKKLLAQADLP